MSKTGNIGLVLGVGAAAALGLMLLAGKSSASTAQPLPVNPPEPTPGPSGPGLQPDPNWPSDLPAEVNYLSFQTANLAVGLQNTLQTAPTDKIACDALLPVAQKLADTWVRLDQSGNAAKLVGSCQGTYVAAKQAGVDANTAVAFGCHLGGGSRESIKASVDKAVTAMTAFAQAFAADCKAASPLPADPSWPADLQGQVNFLSFATAELYGKAQSANFSDVATLAPVNQAAQKLYVAWERFRETDPNRLTGDCKATGQAALTGGLQLSNSINVGFANQTLTKTELDSDVANLTSLMTTFAQTMANGCKAGASPSNLDNAACDADIAWCRDIVGHVNSLKPLCLGGDQTACSEESMWEGQLRTKVAAIFKTCGTVPTDLTPWYQA